jgi:hypothetical protein
MLVAGGNISNIFCTIQTTGFGSPLSHEPCRVLVGVDATLKVGGMVTFTKDAAARFSSPSKSAMLACTSRPSAAARFPNV